MKDMRGMGKLQKSLLDAINQEYAVSTRQIMLDKRWRWTFSSSIRRSLRSLEHRGLISRTKCEASGGTLWWPAGFIDNFEWPGDEP